MTVTKVFEVDESVPYDLRLMAECLLAGDTSSADPLIDCYLENRKGGEQISVRYVEMLEDTLREYKKLVESGRTQTGQWLSQSVKGDARVRKQDADVLSHAYFKCEQMARFLGRQHLS